MTPVYAKQYNKLPNFVYVQVRMKKKTEITLDYIHVREHVQWWSFTEAHGKKKKNTAAWYVANLALSLNNFYQ